MAAIEMVLVRCHWDNIAHWMQCTPRTENYSNCSMPTVVSSKHRQWHRIRTEAQLTFLTQRWHSNRPLLLFRVRNKWVFFRIFNYLSGKNAFQFHFCSMQRAGTETIGQHRCPVGRKSVQFKKQLFDPFRYITMLLGSLMANEDIGDVVYGEASATITSTVCTGHTHRPIDRLTDRPTNRPIVKKIQQQQKRRMNCRSRFIWRWNPPASFMGGNIRSIEFSWIISVFIKSTTHSHHNLRWPVSCLFDTFSCVPAIC